MAFHKPEERGEGEIFRVKLPRGKEILGVIEQRLGQGKMRVKCFDGNSRVCRVPGRLKRKMWLREGDVVLIEPWEYEAKEKGDVLFKYSKSEEQWLRRKGFIKITEEF
jgi:translation initiation factor 1A